MTAYQIRTKEQQYSKDKSCPVQLEILKPLYTQQNDRYHIFSEYPVL